MAIEIERKFLVSRERWNPSGNGKKIKQGYISVEPERVVRIRTLEREAFVTIKGITRGLSRSEFEYPIPFAEANAILEQICVQPVIEKTRYIEVYAGQRWEIDVFGGVNQGLVVAEIELESETQTVSYPDWIGEEVSYDPKYYNVNLIQQPSSTW